MSTSPNASTAEPARKNASNQADAADKKKKKKKKKKGPSEEEVEEEQRILREKARLVMERSEELQRILQENRILNLITTEVGQSLETQVKEHTSIVKDLDEDLVKAEIQIAEWRQNKEEVQTQRDAARLKHETDTQNYKTTHRDAMVLLIAELDREQRLSKANEELRIEKQNVYAALERADEELESSRRLHQLAISDHEHKYLLEKERLKRDMLIKINSTKLGLLDMVEGQLRTTTRRTIIEHEQVNHELRHQSKETQRCLERNDLLRAKLRQLRQEIEVEEDGCAMLAKTELQLQRAVTKASDQLAGLQQVAIQGNLAAAQNHLRAMQQQQQQQQQDQQQIAGANKQAHRKIAHVSETSTRPWLHGAKQTHHIDSSFSVPTGSNRPVGPQGGPPDLVRTASTPLSRLPLEAALTLRYKQKQDALAAQQFGSNAADVEDGGRAAAAAALSKHHQQVLSSRISPSEDKYGILAAGHTARSKNAGKVRELEEAIAARVAELTSIAEKTAKARTLALRTERETTRLLTLQEDALNVIESTLLHMHASGRPCLGLPLSISTQGRNDATTATTTSYSSSSSLTTGLVSWPAWTGIPSRISNVVRADAEALLALLHQKLNVAPIARDARHTLHRDRSSNMLTSSSSSSSTQIAGG